MKTNTKAFIAGFLGLVVAASASAQDRGYRYQEDARPYYVPQQTQYIGPSGYDQNHQDRFEPDWHARQAWRDMHEREWRREEEWRRHEWQRQQEWRRDQAWRREYWHEQRP